MIGARAAVVAAFLAVAASALTQPSGADATREAETIVQIHGVRPFETKRVSRAGETDDVVQPQ